MSAVSAVSAVPVCWVVTEATGDGAQWWVQDADADSVVLAPAAPGAATSTPRPLPQFGMAHLALSETARRAAWAMCALMAFYAVRVHVVPGGPDPAADPHWRERMDLVTVLLDFGAGVAR